MLTVDDIRSIPLFWNTSRGARSNVPVLASSEVVRAPGDTHLTAVDIREGSMAIAFVHKYLQHGAL